MKTEWDYTELADAYVKRPDYAREAIDIMLKKANVHEGDAVCDVGAGAGHLTWMLASENLEVTAIEPNSAMRRNGLKRTASYSNVQWFDGVGEDTGQPDHHFSLVTFGSSFNVTDRPRALRESHRILIPGGWFACLWNHRDLEDPVQKHIEQIIRKHIPSYSYGTRREDQTEVIRASGCFTDIQAFSGRVVHRIRVEDVVEAWQSHATVERQAGERFPAVLSDIGDYLRSFQTETIEVPYITRGWMAKADE